MANKIKDDDFSVGDSVDQILKDISIEVSWTKRKKELFHSLIENLGLEKYVIFHGDFRTYELQTKGASAIYHVPLNQRGSLREFAGKNIRLICLDYSDHWPGYAGRKFAVKAIS